MKKFFVMICVAICAFGAEFNMKPYHTSLLSVSDGFGEIKDSPDIVVGSNAVVIHKLDSEKSTIIAAAVVEEKSNGTAKIKFEVFTDLKQTALPIPNIKPQEGDEVIVNFLYDKSLIVTPNAEIHKQIMNAFKDVQFVSPDIVGAYLSINYQQAPTHKDFEVLCVQNAAGLIFIALDGEAVFADCHSFRVLKSFKSGKISNWQAPFFSNVTKYTKAFWNFSDSGINDYDSYYRSLLRR